MGGNCSTVTSATTIGVGHTVSTRGKPQCFVLVPLTSHYFPSPQCEAFQHLYKIYTDLGIREVFRPHQPLRAIDEYYKETVQGADAMIVRRLCAGGAALHSPYSPPVPCCILHSSGEDAPVEIVGYFGLLPYQEDGSPKVHAMLEIFVQKHVLGQPTASSIFRLGCWLYARSFHSAKVYKPPSVLQPRRSPQQAQAQALPESPKESIPPPRLVDRGVDPPADPGFLDYPTTFGVTFEAASDRNRRMLQDWALIVEQFFPESAEQGGALAKFSRDPVQDKKNSRYFVYAEDDSCAHLLNITNRVADDIAPTASESSRLPPGALELFPMWTPENRCIHIPSFRLMNTSARKDSGFALDATMFLRALANRSSQRQDPGTLNAESDETLQGLSGDQPEHKVEDKKHHVHIEEEDSDGGY